MSGMAASVLKVSEAVFHSTESTTALFVVPLAFVRLFTANISGSREADYTAVLRGVIGYFVLAHSFDWILEVILTIPDHFGPHMGLSLQNPQNSYHADDTSIGSLPLVLRWGGETILSALYYVAVFLNFAVTVLLSAIAPIIFLLCSIFSIGFGVKAFFGLLIMVSSWPIVFAACAEIQSLAIPITGGNAFGLMVFDAMTSFFKIIGPLAMAYFGMHSAPMQSLMSGMRTSIRGGKLAYGLAGKAKDNGMKSPTARNAASFASRAVSQLHPDAISRRMKEANRAKNSALSRDLKNSQSVNPSNNSESPSQPNPNSSTPTPSRPISPPSKPRNDKDPR